MKKNFLLFLLVFLMSAPVKSKAQTSVLSSLPGAQAVLFLDFDGHTVDGTSWNYDGPIYCGGSGLSNTQITEVFNRVSEDYRPFDINVTTDSVKYQQAPYNKRMRVVITVTSDWYGAPAGGVSFIGSFIWGDESPCFVFSQLLNYNVKFIAEACSHEAGHTLGLYHQSSYDNNCVKLSEYNYGTGSGEIGWAPLMGIGYYQNFTLWNNGANPYGCTNYQNDLAVITSQNGFGFRTDDYAETFALAQPVTITANLFTVAGIVEKNSDRDMFKFTLAGPGRFQVNAAPFNANSGNAGANLDIQLTLYNSAQAVIGTYNPGTLLNSAVDTNLSAGVYYLRTEGRGNMFAPDYASLGQYTLQGIFTAAVTLPVRKLILKGRAENSRHVLDWEIDADEKVERQIVEAAEDGVHFTSVHVSTTSAVRTFMYTPRSSGAVTYRLKVLFDNGSEYYSNSIVINNTDENMAPKLLTSLVQDNMTLLAPARYDYTLYNAGGSLVRKGVLVKGTNVVSTGHLSHGVYYLQLTSGSGIYNLRFVKN
jgi:hypothetical protein